MKTLLPRQGVRLAAVAVAWTLLAGQGLCGSAPEPLQNRSGAQATTSSDTPGGESAAPGNVTVTGSGGNQDATVVVTPPVVVPGDTMPPDGTTVGPGGRTVPARPEAATGQTPSGTPDGKGHSLVPVVPGDVKSHTLVPVTPETAKGNDGDKDKGKGSLLVPHVTATGKGGDQHTKVLVTPQAAVPVTQGKGGGVAEPSPPLGLTPGEPVTVPRDGAVFGADGKSVALPPGQAVTLPQGGKMVAPDGRVVQLPPGARVIMPSRAMNPSDFLPKTGGKPEAKPDAAKAPVTKPAADPKKSAPPSPVPGKPGAQLQPSKKNARPPVEPPPVKQEAASKPGERIKIPQDACDKRTVAFLQGCWRGQVLLQDHTRVIIRLCFDASGVGKRIDSYQRNGKKCAGASHASWGHDGLSFSFKKLYCSNGTVGTDIPIVCKGCGENTHCIGTEYRTNVGAIGKTNFKLVKE